MGSESNFIPFPPSVLCHTVITRKLWNSKDDFEKQALTLKKFNFFNFAGMAFITFKVHIFKLLETQFL